jgi:hypothetical protein
MLDRGLFELWGDRDEQELVEKVLELSDEQLLDNAISEAQLSVAEKHSVYEYGLKAARFILSRLRNRRIFRVLCTFDASNRTIVQLSQLRGLYTNVAEKGSDSDPIAATTKAIRCIVIDFQEDILTLKLSALGGLPEYIFLWTTMFTVAYPTNGFG